MAAPFPCCCKQNGTFSVTVHDFAFAPRMLLCIIAHASRNWSCSWGTMINFSVTHPPRALIFGAKWKKKQFCPFHFRQFFVPWRPLPRMSLMQIWPLSIAGNAKGPPEMEFPHFLLACFLKVNEPQRLFSSGILHKRHSCLLSHFLRRPEYD